MEESPICALLLEWNRNTLTARRLSSAALKEFRSFWSNYRWRVTIVGIFNLPIVVSYFRHRINMLDMLTPPVTAFVVLWSRRPVLMPLRYLKEAERLDADSRDAHVKALAQLDDCIAKLSPPVPVVEQHRRSLVKAMIASLPLGQQTAINLLLKYILVRGSRATSDVDSNIICDP